jgi:hypothetical protein
MELAIKKRAENIVVCARRGSMVYFVKLIGVEITAKMMVDAILKQ